MLNFLERLLGRDTESEFKVVNGKIVKDQGEEVEEQLIVEIMKEDLSEIKDYLYKN
ncbi:hypothetical protein [Orenia metallireducens]|uniref:hypothetical protein n=1 Tax=Orenia metallireducens TaxID=1413210 RepID=UPI00159F1687|nr:hypothetical protein [Orenia metallireducens]